MSLSCWTYVSAVGGCDICLFAALCSISLSLSLSACVCVCGLVKPTPCCWFLMSPWKHRGAVADGIFWRNTISPFSKMSCSRATAHHSSHSTLLFLAFIKTADINKNTHIHTHKLAISLTHKLTNTHTHAHTHKHTSIAISFHLFAPCVFVILVVPLLLLERCGVWVLKEGRLKGCVPSAVPGLLGGIRNYSRRRVSCSPLTHLLSLLSLTPLTSSHSSLDLTPLPLSIHPFLSPSLEKENELQSCFDIGVSSFISESGADVFLSLAFSPPLLLSPSLSLLLSFAFLSSAPLVHALSLCLSLKRAGPGASVHLLRQHPLCSGFWESPVSFEVGPPERWAQQQ